MHSLSRKSSKNSTNINFVDLKQAIESDEKKGFRTLKAQFEKLNAECKDNTNACLCGSIMGNVSKNRYKNIVPYDKCRVILGRNWDDYQKQIAPSPCIHGIDTNYINASYIGACNSDLDGNVFPNESFANPEFIVTQDPLSSTTGDFWRMVFEQRCPLIVRLSGTLEKENDNRVYWPEAVDSTLTFKTENCEYCVQLLTEQTMALWTERNFRIWPSDSVETTMFVRHMHYSGWPKDSPPDATTLYKFVCDIDSPTVPIASTAGPVIIHCRGSIGRTGMFLVAVILKKNIERGMRGVSIYGMVKQIRKYRHGLVNSLADYIALHKFAVVAYTRNKDDGAKQLEYGAQS